jgi:PDZ domain-containing protein
VRTQVAPTARPKSFPLAGHRLTPHWWALTGLSLFAGCGPTALRRAAHWGDFVEAPAGETLVREDHGDFWFFIIIAGRVQMMRSGCEVASAAAGSHFGHTAIVGLRPQPFTAVTAEPSTFFVLGAQQFISLVQTSAAFQRSVFPDVGDHGFPDFARRCHADGRDEWRKLTPRFEAAPYRAGGPTSWRAVGPTAKGRPPGRSISLSEAAARLVRSADSSPAAPIRSSPVVLPKRLLATVAAALALVVAVVLLAYHPPRAIVSPGRPIDVAGDIRVSGAPTHPLHGHYLLLWVKTRRPDLAQYLLASVRGQRTAAVPAQSAHEAAVARRLGRRQYLDSRTIAARVATTRLGLDSRRVTVQIRDRGFVGPSAGLVYALAVTDLLGGGDVAHGRIVAATGELEANGKVDPVGWVPVKAAAARWSGATVLLVPWGEQSLVGTGPATFGVTNLAEALNVLDGYS